MNKTDLYVQDIAHWSNAISNVVISRQYYHRAICSAIAWWYIAVDKRDFCGQLIEYVHICMRFGAKILARVYCVVVHCSADLLPDSFSCLFWTGFRSLFVIMATEEATVWFVQEIEKQPAIWDFRDSKHSKRTVLDKAWTAVARDANIAGMFVL